MPYEPKKFDHLISLPGFSNQLIMNHFNLYQGYVNNFNKLNDILVQIEKDDKFLTPEYSELNRRFGWEFNGMRLHEYYFENITKNAEPRQTNSKLAKAIKEEFGSYEMLEKDFKSMGAMRGIGWIILYYDKKANRLFNVWVNEHDTGHFAGCSPLLIMDVFEHAYMIDYQLKKTDYISAFWNAVDWKIVESRFDEATK